MLSGPERTPIIVVDRNGPTFVEISWLTPFGEYDGFRLVYTTPDGPVEVILPRNVFEYRLDFLDPGQCYEIQIYTIVAALESTGQTTDICTSKKVLVNCRCGVERMVDCELPFDLVAIPDILKVHLNLYYFS